MLRLIASFFKFTLFAVIILLLGSYLKWNGHTLSDEVRTQVSHAEQWGHDRAPGLLDSKNALKKHPLHSVTREATPIEQIPASEREKLKDLIRELNSSR